MNLIGKFHDALSESDTKCVSWLFGTPNWLLWIRRLLSYAYLERWTGHRHFNTAIAPLLDSHNKHDRIRKGESSSACWHIADYCRRREWGLRDWGRRGIWRWIVIPKEKRGSVEVAIENRVQLTTVLYRHSYTTSLASSVADHNWVHGRRFHNYREGSALRCFRNQSATRPRSQPSC